MISTFRLLDPSLVLLVGASGSGKSTFAAKHFKPYEVVSSDRCREMITDDAADQSVTPAAFNLVRYLAHCRIQAGRSAVVDATNVQVPARARMIRMAARRHVPISAIVFTVPLQTCLERNARRSERTVPEEAIATQVQALNDSIPAIRVEGYAQLLVLDSPASIDALRIVRR